MSGSPPHIGRGLPPALLARLDRGEWLRTAHQGAPRIAAGNTLRSITAAAGYGVDLVEVDVHITTDHRLALWHDDTIGEGAGALRMAEEDFDLLHGRLADLTGEELVDLPCAMRALRGRTGLMIDLKADHLAAPIIDAVRTEDFAPAVVCGDFWECLREIKRSAPEVGTSLTPLPEWVRVEARPPLSSIDTDAITVPWQFVEPGFVAACRECGLAVLAWTVDDLDLMRKLIGMGVNGITSNLPELFARV